MSNIAAILKEDLGVNQGYQHGPKRVTPGESIETNGAILKWYAVHPEDRHVPDEIDRLARSYLKKTLLEAKGLGFVILHRCGNDFYFLIVSTWRGTTKFGRPSFTKMARPWLTLPYGRAMECISRHSVSGSSLQSGMKRKAGSDFLPQLAMRMPRRFGCAISTPVARRRGLTLPGGSRNKGAARCNF